MSRKTVITCALTGSFDTPSKNPAVPVTPAEIANSALDAAKAGAAVVHIHVRDPKTTKPSMELALYQEVVDRIRDKNGDVVLNLTTGAGGRFAPDPAEPRKAGEGTTLTTPAIRMRHIEAIRPPICTLDVATMNFGETIFANTPSHLREMADRAKAAGAKPEIEVFDLGHIELAKRLIADGHLAEPPLFQICLGISYGAPATPETLIQMRDRLPKNAAWSAFGIGR
ncbi:MAG: 3-keto-5-aminohexanoate cleavage protein, partial [Microvirga sp.]